jgi:hypothetical protein
MPNVSQTSVFFFYNSAESKCLYALHRPGSQPVSQSASQPASQPDIGFSTLTVTGLTGGQAYVMTKGRNTAGPNTRFYHYK